MTETTDRYYGSKRQLEDNHAEAEEMGGGPQYDCWGVGSPDGPCGGCGRCFHMMADHYWHKERERLDRLQAAGFEVADPSVIDTTVMSYGGHVPDENATLMDSARAWVGLGPSHDAYACWCTDERTELSWPWSKPV